MTRKHSKWWFVFLMTIVLIALFFWIKNDAPFYTSQTNSEYVAVEVPSDESCIQCHGHTKGYSKYHNPENIGCTSCHLGDPTTMDKEASHKNMVLIPGNLADAAETCGKCHPNELKKIQTSLMTTNSGLVAVDKFVFGEADSPNYHYHIKDIEDSPSEKHLRDLCANCHLGAEKKTFGAINQRSRGGGCNACHLSYDTNSKADLTNYLNSDKKTLPTYHPATNIFIGNEHCFGCHSRSSRISTNYIGLQETLLDETDILDKTGYKTLDDKRVYKTLQQDVHHSKGMLCIDCHSSHEVMGDGTLYTHEEQAVKLQCSDCHFKEKPNTIPYDSLDLESMLVFSHREYKHNDKPILAVEKDGHPLVNTFVDSLGNAYLIGKKDGKLHPLNPQPEVCKRDVVHQDMACSTCHSAWTSRCIGCHNQFDPDETRAYDLLDKRYVKGQWKEYVAEFSSSLPALGVRESSEVRKHIEPAVPGMILTIDKGSYTDNEIGKDVSFHRLYAPNSPHTTVSEARDCKSCHNTPEAIGYGKGDLRFDVATAQWRFTPEYALNAHDNLPEDAWVPFLNPVHDSIVNSTRTDFRPFTVPEQKQILQVGACLQCHDSKSKVMQQSLMNGIQPLLKRLSKDCVVPKWN